MKKIVSKFNIFTETLKKKDLSKLIKYHYFKIIASIIILFFSFIIYLSLPAFFNYNNYNNNIKKKIYTEFKLDIKNIKGISYSFIPSPHFIIEESDLYFPENDGKKELIKAKNLKVFLYLSNLFNKEKVILKKISLRNNNFYLKNYDFKHFFKHLYYSDNKPIYIHSSNFFYVDNDDQITSITPIKKLDYLVDNKKKQKTLNIVGKLFDIDFKYMWKKDYAKPHILQSNINFKNPNLKIVNLYNKFDNKVEGNSKINFLNNKLNVEFYINNNKIIFKTVKNNIDLPDKFELSGIIDLNPFFFDTSISLSNININLILDKLFYYFHTLNNSIHQNFNGNLNVNFKDLNNKLFENIFFNLKFSDQKIIMLQSSIDIKKIGKIYFSEINYVENNGDLFLESNMKLEVYDQKQFYRKFQVPKRKRVNLREIYFKLKKNINEDFYYISNININKIDENLSNSENIFEIEGQKFNNLHRLSKIIREEF